MVVNEKSLLKAMKEAWKGLGYKVAAEEMGGAVQMLIAAPGWMVVYEKENLSRKVLGLIAEHLGAIPNVGEAYQVSKKENQTEIFDVAMSGLTAIRKNPPERQLITKTNLTLNGYNLWQRNDDGRMVMVNPGLEDILDTQRRPVRMMGEDLMVVYGAVSWGYINIEKDGWKEYDARLLHLSGFSWTST